MLAGVMTRELLLGCFVLAGLIGTTFATVTTGNVYWDDQKHTYYFKAGPVDKQNAVAWGSYDASLNVTGWNELYIESKTTKYNDEQIAYAAGFLEGAFTWQDVYNHYQNMYNFFFNSDPELYNKVVQWLKQQDKWARHRVRLAGAMEPHEKEFWQQVGKVLLQLDGMIAGYASQADASKSLDWSAFAILNANGDLLDLVNALNDFTFEDKELPFIERYMAEHTHCSALIKVTGDFSDMFAAHTSWFTYGAMLRIYKHYDLHYADPSTKSYGVSFSSYPAYMESLDDFYITTSGLIVIETSLGVLNTTLYKLVHPETLLSWQRTIVANRMAGNGSQWADYYSKYQSGTYNNQWLIVDANQFQPNKMLMPGTLWILEQIPGLIHAEDQTDVLSFGYWPSYNIPFYQDVYDKAGYEYYWKKYQSSSFSYQHCPRANIFRRDQDKVTNMTTMQWIMRYNDFEHDPYSKGNPGNAIASRFDLAPPSSAGAFGGYDTKVTNYANALQRISLAINGPTYQQQPVFEWTEQFSATSHVGQPTRFHFPWVTMQPTLQQSRL